MTRLPRRFFLRLWRECHLLYFRASPQTEAYNNVIPASYHTSTTKSWTAHGCLPTHERSGMRLSLDLPDGFEDLRRLPREPERAPDRRIPERKREPLLEPGPLDLRVQRLIEQAEQKRFPEIPRRQYEHQRTPDVSVEREPAERHVRSRHHLPHSLLNLRLHREEKELLGEAGRFRVLALKDAAQTIYGGDERALRSDLRFLEKRGLTSVDIVNARRDGRSQKVERIEVITLTKDGERTALLTNNFEPGQKLYHGLVKPREVEHDSQIYRAYLKEAEQIEKDAGRNLRVQLDFELKSQVQKAIYQARKLEPERELNEIKQQVAQQFDLPYVDKHIQIPDARIRYEIEGEQGQGMIAGHSDIEVVTAAYHPGHLRSKVQAGFHLYLSGRDAASLSSKIEHEHHLLDHVLDL